MSTSAVVPLVFWGSTPPKHAVTCILVTYDQKTVITGSKSGQLGVWDILHLEGGKVEVLKFLTIQISSGFHFAVTVLGKSLSKFMPLISAIGLASILNSIETNNWKSNR